MHRSITEPIRHKQSFDDRWGTVELGLITSWERGREKSAEEPRLAALAAAGQLPVLAWKGGVEKAIQKKVKYGVLNYLAMWQGLRGEDLNIDVEEEVTLTCTATGMTVVFTNDPAKFTE
jgi:hypothetical protein